MLDKQIVLDKICKLKSNGVENAFILLHPLFIKDTGNKNIDISYKFLLYYEAKKATLCVNSSLYIHDDGGWKIEIPTLDDIFLLEKELKKSKRYKYNLKTKKLIDNNSFFYLPF